MRTWIWRTGNESPLGEGVQVLMNFFKSWTFFGLTFVFLVISGYYLYNFHFYNVHAFNFFLVFSLIILAYISLTFGIYHIQKFFFLEKTPESEKLKDTLDVAIKILGIVGGFIYFSFQFFSGISTTGMSVKLDCRFDEKKHILNLKATLKSHLNLIRIYDARAFLYELNEDFLNKEMSDSKQNYDQLGSVDEKKHRFHIFGIKRYSNKGNLLGKDILTGSIDDNLQLNPEDEMELTGILKKKLESKNVYLIRFVLLGKTAFNNGPEQWSSTCLVKEEKDK